jgi:hypothetical protein
MVSPGKDGRIRIHLPQDQIARCEHSSVSRVVGRNIVFSGRESPRNPDPPQVDRSRQGERCWRVALNRVTRLGRSRTNSHVRLARIVLGAHRLRIGRPRTGDLRPRSRHGWRPRTSQRPQEPTSRCGTPNVSATPALPSVGSRGDSNDNALAESIKCWQSTTRRRRSQSPRCLSVNGVVPFVILNRSQAFDADVGRAELRSSIVELDQ